MGRGGKEGGFGSEEGGCWVRSDLLGRKAGLGTGVADGGVEVAELEPQLVELGVPSGQLRRHPARHRHRRRAAVIEPAQGGPTHERTGPGHTRAQRQATDTHRQTHTQASKQQTHTDTDNTQTDRQTDRQTHTNTCK